MYVLNRRVRVRSKLTSSQLAVLFLRIECLLRRYVRPSGRIKPISQNANTQCFSNNNNNNKSVTKWLDLSNIVFGIIAKCQKLNIISYKHNIGNKLNHHHDNTNTRSHTQWRCEWWTDDKNSKKENGLDEGSRNRFLPLFKCIYFIFKSSNKHQSSILSLCIIYAILFAHIHS